MRNVDRLLTERAFAGKMKDVQGIQRGKCNLCECIEYRAPEDGGKCCCDYCGHRPVEHVRIVELGACRAKGCDCDTYSPEDPNSYSDCQYCGCSASLHKGAEALRKRPQQQPTPQYPPTVPVAAVAGVGLVATGQIGGAGTGQMGGAPTPGGQVIQLRPQQNLALGNCSRPGCPYPKRTEGTKVHPYCSKTCAQTHTQAQAASFHAQKLASADQAAKSESQPVAVPAGPGGVAPTQQPPTMCKKCNRLPANPGRGWCESCFRQQQQKP